MRAVSLQMQWFVGIEDQSGLSQPVPRQAEFYEFTPTGQT